jgi:tetratricopeptide (TPR) repeat protein
MNDTENAMVSTIDQPAPDASAPSGAIDPNAIKECLDSGRPLKDLLELGDHVWETMYDFGFRNYQMGQFAAAEYWWGYTSLFDSERDRNWVSLGMAYQRQQKYQEAVNAFSLAVHHGGENPWAPLHAAECHLQLQNVDKAANALDCAEEWIGNGNEQELLRKRIAMLRRGIRKRQQRLAAGAPGADG